MARVIDTRPQAAPPRSTIFDRQAEPELVNPNRRVGGVDLPPGRRLEKAVGDPRNGDFISWDRELAGRGLTTYVESDANGTPALWKGQSTGGGRVVNLSGGTPMSAPMRPHHAGIQGDPPHEGSGAASQPEGGAPPAPAPMVGNMGNMGRSVPFANELAQAGIGIGGAAPQQSEDWIDWTEQQLRFASPAEAVRAGQDAVNQGIPLAALMSSTVAKADEPPAGPAFGAGAGDTFVYGRDDEDSKSPDPEAVEKSLGDFLGPLEALIKAGGHKYTSRKMVNGRWQYEYADDKGGGKSAPSGRNPYVHADEQVSRAIRTAGKQQKEGNAWDAHDYGQVNDAIADAKSAIDNLAAKGHAEELGRLTRQMKSAYKAGGIVGVTQKKLIEHAEKAIEGKKRGAETEKLVNDPENAAVEMLAPHLESAMRWGRDVVSGGKGDPAGFEKVRSALKASAETVKASGSLKAAQAYARRAQRLQTMVSTLGKYAEGEHGKEMVKRVSDLFTDSAREVYKHYTDGPGKPAAAESKAAEPKAEPKPAPKAPAKKPKKRKAASSNQLSLFEKSAAGVDFSGRAAARRLSKAEVSALDSVPEEYLYDYLLAVIEEGYECQRRETAHRTLTAHDQLDALACAVMCWLVRRMVYDHNLVRASRSHGGVTKDVVARILVERGFARPASDIYDHDDRSGNSAMGAMLSEHLELSRKVPWVQAEPAPVVGRVLADRGPEDVSHLVKSEEADPFAELMRRRREEARQHWTVEDPGAAVNVHATCPVHNGRDVTKSHQLHNPHLPCLCGPTANAYG